MLVSLARNKLSLREIHRFQNFPVRTNQYLHWDLPRLWHEVKHGLNKVAEENLPIASLGVDTWGVDFGLLGKEDMLLADPIHYRDSHTEAALPRLLRRLDPVRIYSNYGHPDHATTRWYSWRPCGPPVLPSSLVPQPS